VDKLSSFTIRTLAKRRNPGKLRGVDYTERTSRKKRKNDPVVCWRVKPKRNSMNAKEVDIFLQQVESFRSILSNTEIPIVLLEFAGFTPWPAYLSECTKDIVVENNKIIRFAMQFYSSPKRISVNVCDIWKGKVRMYDIELRSEDVREIARENGARKKWRTAFCNSLKDLNYSKQNIQEFFAACSNTE